MRTNKIKEQLEYSKEQYLEKKEEFELLQLRLAEFRDSNKYISSIKHISSLICSIAPFQPKIIIACIVSKL